MALSSSIYISFPGNAAEAFPYYADLFGGDLDVATYDAMPAMEGLPFTPPPGSVAHGVMTAPGLTISGGDNMGEHLPQLASDVYSFLLVFDRVDEAHDFLGKVTETGGEIAMPFELAPWGEMYGQVHDKFGIRWAVNVPGTPS